MAAGRGSPQGCRWPPSGGPWTARSEASDMTAVLAGLIAGFVAGRLAWVLLRPTFAQPMFSRLNVRNVSVPTACGIVLPIAVGVVEGGRTVLGALGMGDAATPSAPRLAVLVVAFGMGLAGLLDDLAGGRSNDPDAAH